MGASVAVGCGAGSGGAATTGSSSTATVQAINVGLAITQPRRPVAWTRTLSQPPDELRASGSSTVPPGSELVNTG
jgi:hypothetical protein